MSKDSFAIACFHFSPKTPPPFHFRGTDYLAHLRRALESVSNISAVRIETDDELKNRESNLEEALQPLAAGEPFPSPSFMIVQFDIYVPFRVQTELLSDASGRISPEMLRTYTEKFRIRISYGYHGPVAFVEPLKPSKEPAPSDAVVIVRNFLARALAEDTNVRFEFIGPSPFHAECYLEKLESAQDQEPRWRFRSSRHRLPGYDRVVFQYEPDIFASAAEARDDILDEIMDELAFYYAIQRTRNRLFDGWKEIEEITEKIASAQRQSAVAGMCKRLFIQPRLLRECATSITVFSQQQIFTRDMDRRETTRTFTLRHDTNRFALLEIAESKVRIFTYADGQEVKLDTPINKQMLSMKNYAAEDFRAQIADKTREALIAKARAGWATGTRTYGYDLVKVDKHVERRVNADEAATVKRIFEMAAEGIGNRRIVNTLAGENVPAPGRKGWAKGILKTLLVNDLYRGVIVFGKSKSAARGGAASRRESAIPGVTLQAPALRLISDELWAKVQTRKIVTRAHYLRTEDGRLQGKPEAGLAATHLLNGIARCGVCGGALSYSKKNARTKRYYCLTATTKGVAGCKNGHGVPERELDRAVVNALHELLSDQDTVWALVTERAARWRREHESKGSERRNAEKEVARLEEIVSRLTDAIEKGQPVGDRLKERQQELDTLCGRLEEPDDIDLDRDYLVVELNKWVGPLVKSNDPVQTRQVMRHLGISKITVSPDPSGGWRFDGGVNLSGLVGGGAVGTVAAPPDSPHREHSASSRLRAHVSRRWFDLPDGGCYGRSNANVGFSRDEWPSSI